MAVGVWLVDMVRGMVAGYGRRMTAGHDGWIRRGCGSMIGYAG